MRNSNFVSSRGQTYIIAIGFMAVAATVFFMTINTQRAVSDKVNLVNAADAVAYSGASMAARELNFMALTNRTMIANEVAIGHVMAYQTELDVLEDAAINGIGGLLGSIFEALFDMLGGDSAIRAVNDLNQIWSGAYILGVNAVNTLYSDYQQEEYNSLAGIGRNSIVDAAMLTVAGQYIDPNNTGVAIQFGTKSVQNITSGIRITLNNADVLDQLELEANDALAVDKLETDRLVADARIGSPFCAMVMFAAPSAPGTSIFERIVNNPGDPNDFRSTPLWSQCEAYYQGGGAEGGGAVPTASGFFSNPEADGGALLSVIRRTAEVAPSTDWVLNRDEDYRLLGVRIERRGSSEVFWDASNNQINWQTVGNDSIRTRGLLALLFSFSGQASGNAFAYADNASGRIDSAVSFLLEAAGLCEDSECDALNTSAYTGMTRYAILNPMMSDAEGIKVTAILQQSGTCNDSIPQVEDGPLTFTCADANDPLAIPEQKTLTAAAQATIYYKRPECASEPCSTGYVNVDDEIPNLFNPFWQARLISNSAQ